MDRHIVQVGAPPDVACRPFVHALRRRPAFALTVGPAADIASRFRTRALDCAYISPLEYAREGTDYIAVPGAAFSSHLPSGALTLHFRQSLHAVRSLAVDPGASAEIVLAMILLQEMFETRPSIVPVTGTLEAMLAKADAALLTGNLSLEQSPDHPNGIDLVEHWVDLTGLPYVHGFWCTRPGLMTRGHLQAFGDSATEAAIDAVTTTPAMLDGDLPRLHADDLEAVFNAAAYVFGDTEQEAVDQFLRYAYFHGMIPDVPDLRFAGAEEE